MRLEQSSCPSPHLWVARGRRNPQQLFGQFPSRCKPGATPLQAASHRPRACQRNAGDPSPEAIPPSPQPRRACARLALPAGDGGEGCGGVKGVTSPSCGAKDVLQRLSADTPRRLASAGDICDPAASPQGREYLSACQSPQMSLSYREDFGIKGSG